MYVYAIAPIDIWRGWIKESDYLRSIEKLSEYGYGPEDYQRLKVAALELARRAGWEGDFREGPYVSGLPASDLDSWGEILIGWKQDNNGTTFIVSPYKLPWLDKDFHPVS
jgi:hypothetical protein